MTAADGQARVQRQVIDSCGGHAEGTSTVQHRTNCCADLQQTSLDRGQRDTRTQSWTDTDTEAEKNEQTPVSQRHTVTGSEGGSREKREGRRRTPGSDPGTGTTDPC